MAYKVLLLGASYGSLLASKMLFGGHSIHLICLPAEADLINQEGFKVRLPIRGRKDPVLLDSKKLPGKVTAGGVAGVNPADYDLIGLAMQEPQYRVDGVRQLLDAVGKSKVPCMSIMNMPPLAYLRRIPGLDCDKLKPAYTDASVWDSFDPERITLNSPDPQAIRPPEEKINFYDSVFVPLAKWAMLLAGNYRCVTEDGMRTAQEAVHTDIETSRSVYNFVIDLCVKLGANPADLVPFEKYAAAAQSLVRPASAARALSNGVPFIERADKLVQLIAKQKGLSHPAIDAQVALVDERLAQNRKKAAAA